MLRSFGHGRLLEITGLPEWQYPIGAIQLPKELTTNIDVAKTVLRLTGKSESLLKRVSDRPGHDRRYAVDASKIRKDLGWSPAVSFDEGLEAAVRWYRNNETWWKQILSGDYLVRRKVTESQQQGR